MAQKNLERKHTQWTALARYTLLVLVATAPIYAQASPWENAVDVLRASFTGPIARGLSLVALSAA